MYLPLILDKINKMEPVVTDQNGKQLNLRGENLTIRYHLREIYLHIINMSYTNVSVNISENQQKKLKHAVDTKSPVSIRLGYEDSCGSDVIALTNSPVNRMTKAYQDGKGVTIKMSKRQVVHNMKIEGGILGFLAGLAARPCHFWQRPFSQHW